MKYIKEISRLLGWLGFYATIAAIGCLAEGWWYEAPRVTSVGNAILMPALCVALVGWATYHALDLFEF